jgi:hypothetical protein
MRLAFVMYQHSSGDLKFFTRQITGRGLQEEERLRWDSIPELFDVLQIVASDRDDLHNKL